LAQENKKSHTKKI